MPTRLTSSISGCLATPFWSSPVHDDTQTATFYRPDDVWYDFWTHEPVRGKGANIARHSCTIADIPVHFRGGTIIPTRVASSNTTTAVRAENFELIITTGVDRRAEGGCI